MFQRQKYEYEDDLSTDSNLLCPMCLHPFDSPVLTLCNHIFCKDCISIWFEKDLSCPLCREVFKDNALNIEINPDILYQLDQLLVRCTLCRKKHIKRKHFNRHLVEKCPKTIVSCPFSVDECSWQGKRSKLKFHKLTCSCNPNQNFGNDSPQPESQNPSMTNIEDQTNEFSSSRNISLRDRSLTDEDMAIEIQIVTKNKNCELLDLGGNQIGIQTIFKLADCLQNNNKLKIISLCGNDLSKVNIECFTEALVFNNSALEWLDLEATNLTDENAVNVAKMLVKNKSITSLWLSNNQIGYIGMEFLALALINCNRTLKCLDLHNNPLIDDSCVDHLIAVLDENTSLEKVFLSGHVFSSTSKNALRQAADAKPNFRLFI